MSLVELGARRDQMVESDGIICRVKGERMDKAKLRQVTGNAGRFAVHSIKEHKLASLIIAAALIFVIWIYGGAFLSGVRDEFSSRQVQKRETQAATAQEGAQQEKSQADAAAGDRKVEDRIREQSIKPEQERVARGAHDARARTQRAEEHYEQVQKNYRRVDLDDVRLHQRNCTDLRELYPTEIWSGCQ
jgi:hypothetical protein